MWNALTSLWITSHLAFILPKTVKLPQVEHKFAQTKIGSRVYHVLQWAATCFLVWLQATAAVVGCDSLNRHLFNTPAWQATKHYIKCEKQKLRKYLERKEAKFVSCETPRSWARQLCRRGNAPCIRCTIKRIRCSYVDYQSTKAFCKAGLQSLCPNAIHICLNLLDSQLQINKNSGFARATKRERERDSESAKHSLFGSCRKAAQIPPPRPQRMPGCPREPTVHHVHRYWNRPKSLKSLQTVQTTRHTKRGFSFIH